MDLPAVTHRLVSLLRAAGWFLLQVAAIPVLTVVVVGLFVATPALALVMAVAAVFAPTSPDDKIERARRDRRRPLG